MARVWDSMGELNRFFEDLAQGRGGGATDAHQRWGRRDDEWRPKADVFESEDEYTIFLDVPGVRRDRLDINLDADRLTINGERASEAAEGATQKRAERPAGTFMREFSLPQNVERKSIAAEYKDGVLRVRLPKRAQTQSKRIEIKVG